MCSCQILTKCCLFETVPVCYKLINSSIKFEDAHLKIKLNIDIREKVRQEHAFLGW